MELFYDHDHGGFFQSEERSDLVIRLKGDFDGALPTESAVAAGELEILAQFTERASLSEAARKTSAAYVSQMRDSPVGMGKLLSAVLAAEEHPPRLVLSAGTGLRDLHLEAYQHDLPHLLVMGDKDVSDDSEQIAQAFLCEGEFCRAPVSKRSDLQKLLEQLSS